MAQVGNMFEVQSVMTTDVITIRRNATVTEAMELLRKHNVTGLPVVNDDGTIAGIISEKDVLEFLHDIDDIPSKVEDFMTRDVVTFSQDANLIDICDLLLKKHFRRVPIVDGEGKLVGIVTRKDIIQYIVDYHSLFKEVVAAPADETAS